VIYGTGKEGGRMAYWEFDNRDSICSDYLGPMNDKIPFLYIGAINTAPENPSQYVFIETLHLRSDADYIELRTVDFGSHWPPQVWRKHQVVHCNRWGQSWSDSGYTQPGINTEIVRSGSKTQADKPSSEILLRFPSQTNLLDFNVLLYPGEVLLFTPNTVGSHLYFTCKLYKFTIPTGKDLEESKRDAFSKIQKVRSLLDPMADVFRLIAKVDSGLTSQKRKMITHDLDIIDTCIAELMELVA
jgi:hypothetical protein